MAKIMVVDDAPDASEPLAKFLQSAGHTVVVVADGREAMTALLVGELPDVVILDLLMPEMDGPSFLEVTRSYLRLQTLPVIVLTALSEGPLMDRARNAVVNAILLKSKTTYDQILQAVEDSLGRVAAHRTLTPDTSRHFYS
jgi:CheY-like chemotaxis protein